MFFCYIDEAGCTGNLPGKVTDIQPVFVLCGLIVPEPALARLTHDFLALKRQFNPRLAQALEHDLDLVKHEIKGAEDIRKPIRKNLKAKRRAIGFLDKLLALIARRECRILPYIYIKSPARTIDSVALYAKCMQRVSNHFQNFLRQQSALQKVKGVIIADSRNHDLNVRVSHSIFTQKFKTDGDAYPNVIEMPTYGHSDNHAAIQITDILCSAVLFPIATYAYCLGHISGVHVSERYALLQTRYAQTIKTLSFRYHDGQRFRGGVTAHDELLGRSANYFFARPLAAD